MNGILRLVLRYLWFNRIKSIVLIACLTLPLLLPVAVNALVQHYNTVLLARAEATPLIVGAKGNRYDLVLKSLYFDTAYAEQVTMADDVTIKERGYGKAIPLHLFHAVHRFDAEADPATLVENAPLVGTSLAYFKFRGLEVADGSLPLFLGDAVIGARVAARMGVGVGGFLLSDPRSAYDPAKAFQLKMPVVGVLAPSGTPDDDAVFIDVKTAWVIDGVGHGHANMQTIADSTVIDSSRTTKTNVVATAKLVEYQEITDENRSSFHFHGEPGSYPLTSIILIPEDSKARTIAAGWYALNETRDLLDPTVVITELMGLVFQVKTFFDANFILVIVTTGLLVALVLFLSYRLRRPEMETLYKIGCGRMTVFWLQSVELILLLAISAGMAAAGAALSIQWAPEIFGLLA
ncbi:MAG: hypothetical protein CMM50_08890 [Rhodospirillaceae bacterium]|nr:hypothetical protein [Rhodospirillaceae bacterium]